MDKYELLETGTGHPAGWLFEDPGIEVRMNDNGRITIQPEDTQTVYRAAAHPVWETLKAALVHAGTPRGQFVSPEIMRAIRIAAWAPTLHHGPESSRLQVYTQPITLPCDPQPVLGPLRQGLLEILQDMGIFAKPDEEAQRIRAGHQSGHFALREVLDLEERFRF